jgi:hypothetical protein
VGPGVKMDWKRSVIKADMLNYLLVIRLGMALRVTRVEEVYKCTS